MRGTVECMEAVEFYLNLLRTDAGIIIKRPRISFDLRGGVAGRAFYRENKISFNPVLLDQNPEMFVKQTVGHELAHLAAFTKHGLIQAHGIEWKKVMIAIHLPPKRCHNYDTSVAKGRRGIAMCREIL